MKPKVKEKTGKIAKEAKRIPATGQLQFASNEILYFLFVSVLSSWSSSRVGYKAAPLASGQPGAGVAVLFTGEAGGRGSEVGAAEERNQDARRERKDLSWEVPRKVKSK